MCGCWFQGFVWTALPRDRPSPGPPFPWTALPLDRPKFRSFFFPLPPQNSFFSSLSGGSSRGILVVFEAPGPSNVHVWALWLSCGTPAAPPDRAAGARTRHSKRAHLSVPALQTPPKFHEKTPRRRKKRTNFVAGEGKKKREILGSPPFWAPPLGAPPFWPPPFGPPPPDPPTTPPKKKLAKCGLAKFGQDRQIGQIRPACIKKTKQLKKSQKKTTIIKKTNNEHKKIQTIKKKTIDKNSNN